MQGSHQTLLCLKYDISGQEGPAALLVLVQGALAGRFGSKPSWGWQGEDKLLGKQSLLRGICHRSSRKAICILRYCHPEVAYMSALAFSEDALMHQSPHLLPLKSKVNVSTALNREDSPTEGVYGMRSLG